MHWRPRRCSGPGGDVRGGAGSARGKGRTPGARLLAVLLAAVLALLPLVSQPEGVFAVPSQQDGQAAAEQRQAEPSDDFPFLFAAYTVVFVGLVAYLLVMSARQRQLRREVDALRRALEASQGSRADRGGEGGGDGG